MTRVSGSFSLDPGNRPRGLSLIIFIIFHHLHSFPQFLSFISITDLLPSWYPTVLTLSKRTREGKWYLLQFRLKSHRGDLLALLKSPDHLLPPSLSQATALFWLVLLTLLPRGLNLAMCFQRSHWKCFCGLSICHNWCFLHKVLTAMQDTEVEVRLAMV